MLLLQLVYLIIGTYLISNLVVFFLMINNPFKYRDINYTLPFGENTKNQRKKSLKNPMVRYWICNNPDDKMKNNWVILFHGWGRNSKRMISRANIYWENGYSLIFLDARSHGQSSWAWTSKAFDFYIDARRIVELEKIDNPIIHGLSFGSVAASFYAYNFETKAVILEALASNFKYMFTDFLVAMKFPRILYGWIPWLLLKWNLPWDEYSPVNTLKIISSPIFLIHGENDKLFGLKRHYNLNQQSLGNSSNNKSWIVPNSQHSKMDLHKDYSKMLLSFLKNV